MKCNFAPHRSLQVPGRSNLEGVAWRMGVAVMSQRGRRCKAEGSVQVVRSLTNLLNRQRGGLATDNRDRKVRLVFSERKCCSSLLLRAREKLCEEWNSWINSKEKEGIMAIFFVVVVVVVVKICEEEVNLEFYLNILGVVDFWRFLSWQ